MNRNVGAIYSRVHLNHLADAPNWSTREFFIGDLDARRHAAACLNFEIGRQRSGIFLDSLLLNMKILEAQGIPRLDENWLPNSLGHVSRPPIPTVLVGSLPRVGRRGDIFFVPRVLRRNGRQLVRK